MIKKIIRIVLGISFMSHSAYAMMQNMGTSFAPRDPLIATADNFVNQLYKEYENTGIFEGDNAPYKIKKEILEKINTIEKQFRGQLDDLAMADLYYYTTGRKTIVGFMNNFSFNPKNASAFFESYVLSNEDAKILVEFLVHCFKNNLKTKQEIESALRDKKFSYDGIMGTYQLRDRLVADEVDIDDLVQKIMAINNEEDELPPLEQEQKQQPISVAPQTAVRGRMMGGLTMGGNKPSRRGQRQTKPGDEVLQLNEESVVKPARKSVAKIPVEQPSVVKGAPREQETKISITPARAPAEIEKPAVSAANVGQPASEEIKIQQPSARDIKSQKVIAKTPNFADWLQGIMKKAQNAADRAQITAEGFAILRNFEKFLNSSENEAIYEDDSVAPHKIKDDVLKFIYLFYQQLAPYIREDVDLAYNLLYNAPKPYSSTGVVDPNKSLALIMADHASHILEHLDVGDLVQFLVYCFENKLTDSTKIDAALDKYSHTGTLGTQYQLRERLQYYKVDKDDLIQKIIAINSLESQPEEKPEKAPALVVKPGSPVPESPALVKKPEPIPASEQTPATSAPAKSGSGGILAMGPTASSGRSKEKSKAEGKGSQAWGMFAPAQFKAKPEAPVILPLKEEQASVKSARKSATQVTVTQPSTVPVIPPAQEPKVVIKPAEIPEAEVKPVRKSVAKIVEVPTVKPVVAVEVKPEIQEKPALKQPDVKVEPKKEVKVAEEKNIVPSVSTKAQPKPKEKERVLAQQFKVANLIIGEKSFMTGGRRLVNMYLLKVADHNAAQMGGATQSMYHAIKNGDALLQFALNKGIDLQQALTDSTSAKKWLQPQKTGADMDIMINELQSFGYKIEDSGQLTIISNIATQRAKIEEIAKANRFPTVFVVRTSTVATNQAKDWVAVLVTKDGSQTNYFIASSDSAFKLDGVMRSALGTLINIIDGQ